jgi:hypothetical protein
MHADEASLDLRHHVVGLGDKEVLLRLPGLRPLLTLCMKGNSDVTAARCDKSRGGEAGKTPGHGG